jgi:hypothetical protein
MSKRKKRRPKADHSIKTVMGAAWYRRDQWDRLLEISSDRDELEDTYEEWQLMAEDNLRKLSQHGYAIRKVDIDVEEPLSWCKLNHRSVDGDARSEFAVVKLRGLDKKNS